MRRAIVAALLALAIAAPAAAQEETYTIADLEARCAAAEPTQTLDPARLCRLVLALVLFPDAGLEVDATPEDFAAAAELSRPTEPTGIGDGIYLVGSDITPGTYRSPGPVGDRSCYFFILDDAGDFIDSGSNTGQVVVRVPRRAFTVEFSGCQPFERVE